VPGAPLPAASRCAGPGESRDLSVLPYAHDLPDWFEFLRAVRVGVVEGGSGGCRPVGRMAAVDARGAQRAEYGGVADREVGGVLRVDGEPEVVGGVGVLGVHQRSAVDSGDLPVTWIGAARVVVRGDRCWRAWVLVCSGRGVSGCGSTNACRPRGMGSSLLPLLTSVSGYEIGS
jgi:hypothetical protein